MSDHRRQRDDDASEGRGGRTIGRGLVVVALLVLVFAGKLAWDALAAGAHESERGPSVEAEADRRGASTIGSIGAGLMIVGVALARRR